MKKRLSRLTVLVLICSLLLTACGRETSSIDFSDPIRLRDMYTYSRALHYNMAGEQTSMVEYLPDEQGRIGEVRESSEVNVFAEYSYNDEGSLKSIVNARGVTITVMEDTEDHRKAVRDDGDQYYIHHYDETGHETSVEYFVDDALVSTVNYTYDADGKRNRGDEYLGDGSSIGYILYAYD